VANVQSLTNKADVVSELVVDRSQDVWALTETWHSASDDVRLRLATAEGYAVVDVARGAGRAGGVAVIFKKQLRCSQIPCTAVVRYVRGDLRPSDNCQRSRCPAGRALFDHRRNFMMN